MNWSAKITEKSEVTAEGSLTYTFIILRNDEPVNGAMTVTGNPTDIQQMITDKVTVFAQAYELADELPAVGDVIEIIKTE